MSEKNLNAILDETASQRNVDRKAIIKAIQSGISLAARIKTGHDNLKALFELEKGTFSMFQIKRVQELVSDPVHEISVKEARKINPEAQSGDEVAVPFEYPKLGRLAAMIVRRIMKRTIEEIEIDRQREEMELGKWRIAAAEIRGRNDNGDFLCSIGEKQAVLPRKEQALREKLETGRLVQVVIISVSRERHESVYVVSRTHPLLLGALLRREVPEISEGYIIIKGLARDTAGRAKVAVTSKRDEIDAVGACVGPAGQRVQRIIKELGGEKIDIIKWSKKPEELIAAALTPAKVRSVVCNTKTMEATVEVEADQHSIAVGKKGLNIRLAMRLTRWNINIR